METKEIKKAWNELKKSDFRFIGAFFMFSQKRGSATFSFTNTEHDFKKDILGNENIQKFMETTGCEIERYPHATYTTCTMVRFNFPTEECKA